MVKTGPKALSNHTEKSLMSLAQTLYHYMDLLWIPVALLLMEKGKRLFTCGFVLSCALLLRLQVELMESIGFHKGFFGLLKGDVFSRGLIVYGLFTLIFLLLAYFSPGSDKNIHIAASITIFFAAFCISTLVMVL